MALTTQIRTTNATQIRNSRYVQGGTTDVYNKRLGWWERRNISTAHDDIIVTINVEEVGRPDLIAHRLYQKAELGWLVLLFNNIVDPIVELAANTQIKMPSQSRVLMSILTNPVGGNVVA